MKTATNVLNTLTQAFATPEVQEPKSVIKPFVDYVSSQLEYLKSDEDVLLETQEQIMSLIWAAKRKISKQ